MKIFFICMALGCFLAACGSKKEATERSNVIPVAEGVANVVDGLLLSKAVDSIEIVSLETTDRSVFNYAKIRNIVVSPELILVNTMGQVLCFSREGKYLRDIGQLGQGDVDFQYCSGIGIDEDNRCIYVASGFGGENEVKVYSYGGDFLRGMPVAERGSFLQGRTDHRELRDYAFVKGEHLLRRMLSTWDGSTDIWQMEWLDVSGDVLDKVYNPVGKGYEKELSTYHSFPFDNFALYSPMVNVYGDNINVLFEANDTVYRYDQSGHVLGCRYVLDMNWDSHLDFETLAKDEKKDVYFEAITAKEVYEARDYVYVSVEKDDYSYLVEWNKRTGEACSVRNKGEMKETIIGGILFRETLEAGWVNDICGGPNFYQDHHNENEWIAVYPAEKLAEVDVDALRQAQVGNPAQRDELVKLIEGLDAEADNPVLMIAALKK